MKTKEMIEARLLEMFSKLKQAREHEKLAQTGPDQAVALQRQARLEGNIGALEWVLRENE